MNIKDMKELLSPAGTANVVYLKGGFHEKELIDAALDDIAVKVSFVAAGMVEFTASEKLLFSILTAAAEKFKGE